MIGARGQVRVFVVDDEFSLLTTIAANLELDGFQVIESSDPAKALAMADHTDFDVLLTDVRMPGMNGVDLFRAMARKKPGLRAIMMTAFANEDLLDKGIREGAYTVLKKPFDMDRLSKLIDRAACKGAVLIVDDKPEVAQTLAAALQAGGIDAIDASSASQALELLASAPVDSCVVDLVMANTDGAALCRKIREHSESIVLLSMTAYDVPDSVAGAAAAGSYACLRKPFKVEVLLRTLVRARLER